MLRPQRSAFRDHIDLSGIWRVRFDPEDVGASQGWAAGIGQGHAIAVPGSWNEQLAELGAMSYVGTAWYERTIDVPGCPLWSPASPVLWDLSLTAHDASGAAVDAVSPRTGLREVRVHGQRLLLNGQPLILKGFGKHEDSPSTGAA